MCAVRKLAIPAGLAMLLGLSSASWAEKILDPRALVPITEEQIERLETLAANVGWGLLFRTEQMAIADSAYGTGPVLSFSATPYTPTLFFLESRAWAVERFLDEAGADTRLDAFAIDPVDGLLFDILILSETEEDIKSDGFSITYRDNTVSSIPVAVTQHELSLEQAMGGDMYVARARGRVDLPPDHDWNRVSTMDLQFRAGAQAFDLTWALVLPNP